MTELVVHRVNAKDVCQQGNIFPGSFGAYAKFFTESGCVWVTSRNYLTVHLQSGL
jgi:hypothetical protein